MKLIVVLVGVLAVTLAAPTEDSKIAELRALPALEYEVEHDELGQYSFHFTTAEGTFVKEHGHLVPSADGKERVLYVEGEVIYVGDDGKTYITKYHAGTEGNRVEGKHLPVPPQPIKI